MNIVSYNSRIEPSDCAISNFSNSVETIIQGNPRIIVNFEIFSHSMNEVSELYDFLMSLDNKEFKVDILEKEFKNRISDLKNEVEQLLNKKQVLESNNIKKIEEQMEKDTITSLEI